MEAVWFRGIRISLPELESQLYHLITVRAGQASGALSAPVSITTFVYSVVVRTECDGQDNACPIVL